ncbi:MAG: hypothetical protein WA750_17490 [Pseudolabrys sp.]
MIAKRSIATVRCHVVAAANMVEIAALVGDTARATMLAALMGGAGAYQQRAGRARASLASDRQ